MEKRYKVVDSEEVELGRFKIILDKVEECGNIYPYSYIKMKKSVGVLPICDNNVLLIRQYRHAVCEYEYEIPGGGLDTDEDPKDAAERELFEETGFVADSINFLGSYYPSPGSSNEETFLYVAFGHVKSQPVKEPLEYIESEFVKISQMDELIAKGKIKHGMGLVAWLHYKEWRDKEC